MTPSDRGFQREVNAPKASLSTLQKVVRYAEKGKNTWKFIHKKLSSR
jgi:hypothetical protein